MDSKIPVILITGHGDVEMAVDAMRNGAFDFIEKPSSSDKLLSIIARAVEKTAIGFRKSAITGESATGKWPGADWS